MCRFSGKIGLDKRTSVRKGVRVWVRERVR